MDGNAPIDRLDSEVEQAQPALGEQEHPGPQDRTEEQDRTEPKHPVAPQDRFEGKSRIEGEAGGDQRVRSEPEDRFEQEAGPKKEDGARQKEPSDQRARGRQSPSRRQQRSEGRGQRRRRDRSETAGDPEHQGFREQDELRAPGEPLGVLEVLGRGSGFIRRRDAGYTASKEDIYVGAKLIHKFGLRTGDELSGSVGRRPRNGKSPPLTHLALVNGGLPEDAKRRPGFNRLSAVHPDSQLVLACDRVVAGQPDYTNRVIDLFCPFGKGQRAMIVAPSKAGKTTILQSVAQGIVTNHPECLLLVLLCDERPEEITEMEMCGFGEVVASSFDRPAERHCQVAEMTLERARRMVEGGQDVVIILDSITRLARAYNTVEEGSGRTLSGGLDANSLEKPKRFIGSARKIDPRQGGGSLTIVATALVDTGSRMDQVIFEEFKGTGNSELVLSRELADKRIFPAIDLIGSATRKEELLLDPDTLSVSRAMRRQLSDVSPPDAMSELLGVMRRTRTNEGLVALAQQRI